MKAVIVHNLNNPYVSSPKEIVDLAEAASYNVVEQFLVDMDQPHSRQYLTEYKLEELKSIVAEANATKVIVDDRLRPHQTFALEEALEMDVLDKPMIVLEIFEKKANSKDIKMQIQLAQLKYAVPRMVTEMGEAVRSERPGFGGGGEQVTDILVSDMNRRIKTLERKIDKYRDKFAQKYESDVPRIPIVGHYSSGKSTLFNILTGSQREVGQEAFTTMILKTGRSEVTGYPVDIIDTVGLVDLPPDILSAFDLMLRSIFSFSGMILCLDASLPFDKWQSQLLDFKSYVEKFTDDGIIKIMVFLTKADLVDQSKIQELKKKVHEQVWLTNYIIMVSDYNREEEIKEQFVSNFEELFADDLLEFYYQHISPSQASKLHDVARIEDQEWHSDGTTSLSGIGPKSQLNKIRGDIL